MRSLLILILFTLLSCENNFESIQDISLKRKFPSGITKNLKLTYTDSAMVKAIRNIEKALGSNIKKGTTVMVIPFFILIVLLKLCVLLTLNFSSNFLS